MTATPAESPPSPLGARTVAADPAPAPGRRPPDALPAMAVLNDLGIDVDALLASVVDELKRQGRHVQGLLMRFPEGRDGCVGTMVMHDLEDGTEYLVSQPMGRDSRACRADPGGFARASAALRRVHDAPPDVVVLNRFGSLEAEGGGFRAELLDILAQGLPLLTAVSPKHLAAWREFLGHAAELPADPAAVMQWLSTVLPARAARQASSPAVRTTG